MIKTVYHAKSMVRKYATKYRKDIKVAHLTFLGSGSCGVAFLYGDRVIKITSDYEDYKTAKALINTKLKTFADCYSVDAVTSKGQKYYVIETKYEGDVVRKKFGELSRMNDIFQTCWEFFFYSWVIDDKPFNAFWGRYEVSLNWGAEDKPFVKKVFEFYHQLHKDFSMMNGNSFDYHSNNVCLNNNKIKVIDFGYSGSKNNDTSGIKFKKIA